MTKRQELQGSRKVDHATASQTKTWIDRELAGSEFRDVRLNKRFRKLFEQLNGRLYCTQRALWKLRWFLRDFGYDPDLLGRDEVDEKALVGLRGIVRISRTTLNGRSFLNLGGFAPASEWEELSVSAASNQEVTRDV